MKSIKLREPIGDAAFQKIAYIGLRNEDGSYMLNVPLYVKLSEVTINGIGISQEKLIHKVSEIMIHQYENRISSYIKDIEENKKTDSTQ